MIEKQKVISLLGAILGVSSLLIGLLVMNGFEKSRDKNSGKKSTAFQIIKQHKKKKKLIQKIKPKPKRKSRAKISPPLIPGAMGGASFGLEQFEFLGEAGNGLLGDSENVIMTEGTVDEIPRPRYRAAMEYPGHARARSIEGHVILNLLVGVRGEVEDVRLLGSDPEGVFDSVAVASAHHWQFEPASYQGKKVKVWVRQRIAFNLN